MHVCSEQFFEHLETRESLETKEICLTYGGNDVVDAQESLIAVFIV